MSSVQLEEILEGVRSGKIVPYLGPGVLADVTSARRWASDPCGGRAADPGAERGPAAPLRS